MNIIKLYEEFWGRKKSSSNEDLEFDFLALVSKRSFMSKIIDKLKENPFFRVEKSYYKCPICNGDLYVADSWMDMVMDGQNLRWRLKGRGPSLYI